MAGNYPDPGSWRMALDRDGSVMTICNEAGVIRQLTETEVRSANDEFAANNQNYLQGNGSFVHHIAVIFPEKRDIDAWLLRTENAPGNVETSLNSTNGLDGTWTQVAAYNGKPNSANWRTDITAGTVLAVKAIRFRFYGTTQWVYLGSLHLWGEIAPTENVDRLCFWDPISDNKMNPAHLDWGDTPRSSSADKVVRVKNLSPLKQASNIRVSFDILTDALAGSPSVPSQHLVSYNGGAFLSQVNIGALAGGAVSGPITIRRVTPSNAQLGLFAPRVSAVADTFA